VNTKSIQISEETHLFHHTSQEYQNGLKFLEHPFLPVMWLKTGIR